MTDDNQVLLPAEIGEILRVHESTVRKMLNNGELPRLKVGKRFRMTRRQLNQWIERQSRDEKQPKQSRPTPRGIVLPAKRYV